MIVDTEWHEVPMDCKKLKVRVKDSDKKYGATLTGTNEFWAYMLPTYEQDLIQAMTQLALTLPAIPEMGRYHELTMDINWNQGIDAIPDAIKLLKEYKTKGT